MSTVEQSRSLLIKPLVWLAILPVAALGILSVWLTPRTQPRPAGSIGTVTHPASKIVGGSITNIYAHNLRLHQGPAFRVYVQWLKGQLLPAKKGQTPSFDDPQSFYLNVTNGVIRANLGDICNYLSNQAKDAPLKDIKLSGTGNQVTVTGTLHRVIPIPVELTGVLMPLGDRKIQLHVTKIDALKLPLKRLLGGFHLSLSSFMSSTSVPGLAVNGNDLYFDPEELLPPPHIRGTLTSITMSSPDLQAVYGNGTQDEERVEQWRNFLRLRDGSLNFGKLTMNKVDLMMIDISQDAWFDLDLANYQAQLVNGYTRMTPEAGLQIFMPDVSDLKKGTAQNVSIEWFKNRNLAPPANVLPQNHP